MTKKLSLLDIGTLKNKVICLIDKFKKLHRAKEFKFYDQKDLIFHLYMGEQIYFNSKKCISGKNSFF